MVEDGLRPVPPDAFFHPPHFHRSIPFFEISGNYVNHFSMNKK
jgi:hypothetical protein